MRLLAQTDDATKGLFDNLLLDEWRLPFGDWMDQSVDWIDNNLAWLLDAIAWPFRTLIGWLIDDFSFSLANISWVWVVLLMGVIASLARNIKVGAFVAFALFLCGILGNAYWIETARTIGFIGVAVLLCVAVGIPIGIVCGRVDSVWQVVRPILDAMQVVHSFVYMLPFIFFWGIGEVSATMVTMVFALPPLIRLTNLGIRQVPEDVVEAARAYGAPESRVLFDVQLPLARPAIMTGINQTLLLAISMLGIAAIMGAGGLGRLLFRALSNQDVALAASGGLAFFLVAVVLDRMSQREDGDGGSLFRRIRQAWAHRADPEVLIPDTDTAPAEADDATERFAPIAGNERSLMGLTALGALVAGIATFMTWSVDGGKISGYGRRADENLTGLSFSGLDASGGTWFGILVLLTALFTILAVIVAYQRPGRGPRWLAADGAVIATFAMAATAIAFVYAQDVASSGVATTESVPVGTGIGAWLAVVGAVVAAVGSVLWTRAADHSPLHPLSSKVSPARLIAVGIALVALIVGMVSGWTFDGRSDVVVSVELQERIDELRQRAIDEPENAGAISAELSAAMAQAQQSNVRVTDGASSDGPRFGLLVLILGLAAAAASLPAVGLFGHAEDKKWLWSSLVAGLGTGAAAVSLAWILTHVRSADPNYLSGVGSFMAMAGGFFILASTMSVLREFRRSKIYDDAPPEGATVPAEEAVEELV